MRIHTKRTPIPDVPPPTFRLRAHIERSEDAPGGVAFVVTITGKDGQPVPTRLIDGEYIDFTIELP